MSRERPPRTDIPRNLSFIAALSERAYYRSQRPSLEEEPQPEEEEPELREGGGARLRPRSRALAPGRGRRARSAPAGGGARAPRSRSPDTRKRVRFADALGLELAAVRRFSPGELPRVPRHVQIQLQRDALRHFGPCPPQNPQSPGGARCPRARPRARLRRPPAGPAHMPGTSRGGPAGRGWERARAGPGLRETRERALERGRLAQPARSSRHLRRPGSAPAASGSIRLPLARPANRRLPAFRPALPRNRS